MAELSGDLISTESERAIRSLASGDATRVADVTNWLMSLDDEAVDQLMNGVHRDVVAERTLDIQDVKSAFTVLESDRNGGLAAARGAIGFAFLIALAERWQDLRWQLDPLSVKEQATAEQALEGKEISERAALEKVNPNVARFLKDRRRCLELNQTGEQIQSLLDMQEVKDFLIAKYKVKTTKATHVDTEEPLRFHKSGTTSIILSVNLNGGPRAALKILKPQYFDNGRIRSQMGRCGMDLKAFRARKRVPEVYDRGVDQTYVLMEYVAGCTLREFFEGIGRIDDEGQRREARLMTAVKVMDDVCRTLKDFATTLERPLYHHDLSPDNLILLDTESSDDGQTCVRGGDFKQVWLIDWGFNYLLSESVGSNSARIQLQSYVDPDLSHVRKGGVLADVYSLGAIYLEMIMDGSFGAEEQGTLLDKAWMAFPGIAQRVEEMIDRNPCNRLPHLDAFCIRELTHSQESLEGEREPGPVAVNKECLASVYDSIKQWVDIQHALVLDAGPGEAGDDSPLAVFTWVLDKAGRAARFVTGIDLGMVKAQGDKLDRLRHSVGFRSKAPEYQEAARALGWMYWSQFWSAVVFCSIAWVSVRDFQSGALLQGLPGQLATWPSRAVTLTFGLVASMYYMKMYSEISSWDLGLQGKLVHAWMRFNSFCFAGPILMAVWFYPAEWPFWSAVGVLLTALNNLFTFLPARRAKRAAIDWLKLPDSQRIVGFLSDYRLWWVYMMIYAGALALVTVLLRVGLLQDEWFYGGLTAAVNILMMCVNASGDNVTKIRSGLQTMYSRLDHASLIKARTPAIEESPGPESPVPSMRTTVPEVI